MLQIVPLRVKFKIALLILLATGLLSLPYLLPLVSTYRFFISFILSASGIFALWCFWPKFSWGLHCEKLSPEANQSFHLTFDDGPTIGLTDEILDRLRDLNLKASFFVLVDKAEKAPELIGRILAEGHQLGLHGQNHRLPFFRSKEDLIESLGKAHQRLEEIAQHKVSLYRPSHGWKTPALVRAVHSLGLKFCFWDWGLWDTDNPAEEVLKKRFECAKSLAKLQKRHVILLHDGRGDEKVVPDHAPVLKALL